MTGSSLNVDFENLDFEGYNYKVRAKCGSLKVSFIDVVADMLFG